MYYFLLLILITTIYYKTSAIGPIKFTLLEMQEIGSNRDTLYVYFKNNECGAFLPFNKMLLVIHNLNVNHSYANLHSLVDRIHKEYVTIQNDIFIKALIEANLLLNANQQKLKLNDLDNITSSLKAYQHYYNAPR